jgi:hypothetical protein
MLLENSQGGISLISNLPQEEIHIPARDMWSAWKREREVTKYSAVTVMSHFVQHPVSALAHT